jgi:hypothetical protein
MTTARQSAPRPENARFNLEMVGGGLLRRQLDR